MQKTVDGTKKWYKKVGEWGEGGDSNDIIASSVHAHARFVKRAQHQRIEVNALAVKFHLARTLC